MATRWGICSAGLICHDFVAAMKLLSESEHTVVAVAARDLTKAKEFADSFSIPKAYGSYEELANDSNIEIVYVGTIHPTHHSTCLTMMNAGKHVLCEKPLAMNLKQVKEMIQVAKENNVFLMEAVWSRFFPAYEQVRRELQAETIGIPRCVRVCFGFPTTKDRALRKELGGSAVLDMGVYTIQLACMVFKEKPQKIQAIGFLSDEGVDIMAGITLIYSGNRMAQLSTAFNCVLDQNAFICGTTGVLQLPNFWNSTRLITPKKTHDFPLPKSPKPLNFLNSEGLIYEIQAVRNSLLRGEKENILMTHDDSIQLVEIMDEVRKQLGVTYDVDSC